MSDHERVLPWSVGRVTGRGSGAELPWNSVFAIWTAGGGLIVRIDGYPTRALALAAAGQKLGRHPEEQAREFPCDRYLDRPVVACHRAIDIEASPDVVFRWVCQLRAAPYSYDLLDNFGRRSPQEYAWGSNHLRSART